MYYLITIPLALLVSVGFGFMQVKRTEDIGTGKVQAFLLLTVLILILIGVKSLIG